MLHRVYIRQKGFNIIELMVVLSVIALLAAIALPSYKEHIIKGWRSEGRSALLQLLLDQERYINMTGQYKAFPAGGSDVPFKTYSGETVAVSSYLLGARNCTDNGLRECIIVYAQPTAHKEDPVIRELVIDSTGKRSCTVNTGNDTSVCWP